MAVHIEGGRCGTRNHGAVREGWPHGATHLPAERVERGARLSGEPIGEGVRRARARLCEGGAISEDRSALVGRRHRKCGGEENRCKHAPSGVRAGARAEAHSDTSRVSAASAQPKGRW